MNGLLLAAGLGTRFKPYTEKIPKPVIPLLNVPISFYNLHLIQQIGIDKLTVNTHHLPDVLKNIFSDEKLIAAPTFFSDEKKVILGTGGAIKKARPTLKGSGTFVVANADVVNGFGLRDALEFHHHHQPVATMIVMKHPDAGSKYGAVWVDEKKRVVGISKKKPDLNCKPFHFVGIHFIEESVFKFIPDGPCSITEDVYLKIIEQGKEILAFQKTGFWYDAGNLQDYLAATEGLLGLLPKLQHQPYLLSLFRRFWNGFDRRPNIWEGEGCEHLIALGSKNKVLLGNNCRIHPTVKITGFAVLGDNVVIDKNVCLHNVAISHSVKVKDGTSHKNTLVI